jgi:metal-responsive CopG/Arc/MetJ family transcriptional regulator
MEKRGMETISLKIASTILMRMDDHLEKSNYTTRSEFIRDAIRDKLDSLENQKFESEVRNYLNISTKNVEVDKTHQNRASEIEKAKRDIFLELERKFDGLREHSR